MPSYVVRSDSAIEVREIDGGSPEHPWVPPSRPSLPPDWQRPELPDLPPRDQWPPLPPFFQPGVGLPIPPTPEFPMVPIPPGEGDGEEGVWPPIPSPPTLPDLSGKSLALAVIYLSRHVKVVRWVVIDHEEAKEKFQQAVDKVKGKLPAGGVGGTPPQRPTPGR